MVGGGKRSSKRIPASACAVEWMVMGTLRLGHRKERDQVWAGVRKIMSCHCGRVGFSCQHDVF